MADAKKSPEKKKSAERVPFHYTVLGVKLRQEPLKMFQIRDFVNLFSKFKIDDDKVKKAGVTFEDVTEMLFSEKLQEVAVILFGVVAAKIEWDKADGNDVADMVEDFFDLNPSLIARLKELAASFVLSR